MAQTQAILKTVFAGRVQDITVPLKNNISSNMVPFGTTLNLSAE